MRYILFLFLTLSCFRPGISQDITNQLFKGARSITVPFHYEQNFIVVDIVLGKKYPARFIVDTGSEHTILFDKRIGDILGFPLSKRVPIYGADYRNKIWAYISRDVDLRLPGMINRELDIIILDENKTLLSQTIGAPIDGIIGGSFFRNVVLQIDYKREELILHDANKFKSPIQDGFTSIPLRMEKNKPFIDVACKIDSDTIFQLNFLLDTGSSIPIIIFDDRMNMVIPDSTYAGNIGHGLGGWLVGRSARIKSLRLGDYELANPVVYFQEIQEIPDSLPLYSRDGLLGSDLLDGFHVYIDYVHSVLYVKGRKSWQQPLDYDRSGLTIMAYGHHLDKYIIQNVAPGSPAAEVGLRRGDIIKKVGVWPASWLSLGVINSHLRRKPGKRIRLKVIRDQVVMKKSFVLRDLL